MRYFTILLLLATPVMARAQDRAHAPRPYVRFEIDGDAERALTDFLSSKSGQDLLSKLFQSELKNFIENPPKDLAGLEKLESQNPFVRAIIDQVKKSNPELPLGNPGAMEDVLKKFGKDLNVDPMLAENLLKSIEGTDPELLKSIAEMIGGGKNPIEGLDRATVAPPANAPQSLDDRFTGWLKDWLNEDGRQEEIADFLKDSPALQDAVTDLARSLRGEGINGSLPKAPDIGIDWTPELSPPSLPKMPFDMGSMPSMPTLPKMMMPDLPRFETPLPQMGGFSLPPVPGFGGGMPGMPSGPSGLGGGSEWIIPILAVFGLGFVLWLAQHFLGRRGKPAHANLAETLAAMPAVIDTRSQLRRAFDTLALTHLGPSAESWNHRLVAEGLGGTSHRPAANALADLYEIARYTPGDDRLSEDEKAAVRRSLAALTGAPA